MNIISLVQESRFILIYFIPFEVFVRGHYRCQRQSANVRTQLLLFGFLTCARSDAFCSICSFSVWTNVVSGVQGVLKCVCVRARAHAPWCFQAQLVRPLCFIADDQTWTVCSLVWISPVNRRSAILFWWRIKTGVQDKPRLCTCVNVTFICRLWLFSGIACTPLLCLFFLRVWGRWCEWAHLCVTAQTVWCCSV